MCVRKRTGYTETAEWPGTRKQVRIVSMEKHSRWGEQPGYVKFLYSAHDVVIDTLRIDHPGRRALLATKLLHTLRQIGTLEGPKARMLQRPDDGVTVVLRSQHEYQCTRACNRAP